MRRQTSVKADLSAPAGMEMIFRRTTGPTGGVVDKRDVKVVGQSMGL